MVPHGFRFNPTDEELIQILHQKASGQEMPLDFIVQANIYDREPQHLEWNQTAGTNNGERYYYCKKESDSREVAGRGWWKATSHLKKVHAGEQLVGYKRPLTFHRFKDINQRSRGNAIKTNWIMHEYRLEGNSTEWRLCKIKYKGKRRHPEETENLRQGTLQNNFEAGSSNTSIPASDINVSHQSSTTPLDGGYQPSQCEWDIEYEPHEYPYDINGDYCYHDLVDQQQQAEPTEESFPSLWSWQN